MIEQFIELNIQKAAQLKIAREALDFYAQGSKVIGFDHGEAAKKALQQIQELDGKTN